MNKMLVWDYMSQPFHFHADADKCIHCGKCMEVCSTQILYEDKKTGQVAYPPE